MDGNLGDTTSVVVEDEDRDSTKSSGFSSIENDEKRSESFSFDKKVTSDIGTQAGKPHSRRKCCANGAAFWCKKYFWEGQQLNKSHEKALENLGKDMPAHKRILIKHRRIIGLIIPALFFHFCWWGVMIQHNLWYLFKEKYFMTITMVVGSIIAGMTSEGGGAIAFPVMTLAFKIAPNVARDFSMLIQSCGMSAAAFTIFFMKVQVEWHSVILCSLGGAAGMILGLHLIDPYLSPAQKKMAFVSIWFSFAFALFLLNRYHKRKTYNKIQNFKWWKGLVLFIAGISGGIFTSFAGSGLDICSFSVLTLLFRISEKVATPTSVILMAGNSLVGSYWQAVMTENLASEALEFVAVCVPVVVLGAPLGSVLGSHFHRLVLAAFVYIVDIAALIGAFVLVKQTAFLAGLSVGIMVFFFFFFILITYIGNKLMQRQEKEDEKIKRKDDSSVKVVIKQTEKETGAPGVYQLKDEKMGSNVYVVELPGKSNTADDDTSSGCATKL